MMFLAFARLVQCLALVSAGVGIFGPSLRCIPTEEKLYGLEGERFRS